MTEQEASRLRMSMYWWFKYNIGPKACKLGIHWYHKVNLGLGPVDVCGFCEKRKDERYWEK